MIALEKRVDVGTDEEESRGGGGGPGTPVDHHLLHFILGGPTLVGDSHTKINAGASPLHFWVAAPRKGVGPARMRRGDVLI